MYKGKGVPPPLNDLQSAPTATPPTKNSVSPQLTAVAPSTSARLSPPYGFVAATLVASAKAPKPSAVKVTYQAAARKTKAIPAGTKHGD